VDFVLLVRTALAELVSATGLDTMYLTRVSLADGRQEVLLAHNAGKELVPEGLAVPWEDTLCRRALASGPTYTDDVARDFADVAVAAALGITTYITVPILSQGGDLVGTLCGASATPASLDPQARTLIEVFAQAMTPQLAAAPRSGAAPLPRQAERVAILGSVPLS